MTREVRVTSPAKINLALRVGPVREDGYHPLATVYQAVGLRDEVSLRPAAAGSPGSLVVVADGVDAAEVPTGPDNLVCRAVRLLGEHHGRDLAVDVEVRKRIPVAGGLAGGSTDAAAALVGADALFGLGTSEDDLLELAARLGSDVPFCLLGGTASGGGRGELVCPVPTRGVFWWVIVPDRVGLSTPAVYAEFDRLAGDGVPASVAVPSELLDALRDGDAVRLGARLSNDLQPAALSFRPDLGRLLEAGLECSAHGALVSGSGPTTVFLCDSERHATHVARALRQRHGVPRTLVAPGPVPGVSCPGLTTEWPVRAR
jgi:4-diphosphocytidyl-2-C-methyl-D-erythritol kinase